MEIIKGVIKSRKEIWCGICGNWEDLPSVKYASIEAKARKFGWKKTKKYGWVCPKCVSIKAHKQ